MAKVKEIFDRLGDQDNVETIEISRSVLRAFLDGEELSNDVITAMDEAQGQTYDGNPRLLAILVLPE